MLPLLAAIIPSIIGVVGDMIRGKSKVVDMALDIVQDVVKTPINSSTDMEKALEKATPVQLLALRQADAQFKIEFNEIILGLADAEVKDRAQARSKWVEAKSRMPAILTLLLVVGYFSLTFMSFFHPLEAGMKAIFEQIMGGLRDTLMVVVGYWFGSSLGSRSKDLMR